MDGVDGAALDAGAHGGANGGGDAGGRSDGGDGPFIYTGQDPAQIPRDVTRVAVDPSVKVIGKGAFQYCKQLVEIQLCDGLARIEEDAFDGCSVLTSIRIPSGVTAVGQYAFLHSGLTNIKVPSSVKVIGEGAFESCSKLIDAELCEGLEEIADDAFCACALVNVEVPSSVKEIPFGAFSFCKKLVEVKLHEGLERIEGQAFSKCLSLRKMNIPASVTEIGPRAFEHCHSLRNLTMPASAQALQTNFFTECHDLRMLFNSQEEVESALESRFVGLPIHELCFSGPQLHQIEVVLGQLNSLLGAKNNTWNQDCLGMTPLHILACSAVHNLDLYRIMISHDPDSIIKEDKWGCLPLVYAIWGNHSEEAVQLLVDAQKSIFPDFNLNWDKMIGELCRTGASLECVTRLLQIQQEWFPDQTFHTQKAAKELTIMCLVQTSEYFSFPDSYIRDFFTRWNSLLRALGSSPAQHLVPTLMEIESRVFPDQNEFMLERACEEFVQPLIGWWHLDENVGGSDMADIFCFLVRCRVPDHFLSGYIQPLIQEIPTGSLLKRRAKLEAIHVKLKKSLETAVLLELALWKSKVQESVESHDNRNGEMNDPGLKRECRINCGANVIIPNVLKYLI